MRHAPAAHRLASRWRSCWLARRSRSCFGTGPSTARPSTEPPRALAPKLNARALILCALRASALAHRRNSSFYYFVFLFCFSFHCAFVIVLTVGIPNSGGGGWIYAFSTLGANVGAGIILLISSVFWTLLSVYCCFQLLNVRACSVIVRGIPSLTWAGPHAPCRVFRFVGPLGVPPLPVVRRIGQEGVERSDDRGRLVRSRPGGDPSRRDHRRQQCRARRRPECARHRQQCLKKRTARRAETCSPMSCSPLCQLHSAQEQGEDTGRGKDTGRGRGPSSPPGASTHLRLRDHVVDADFAVAGGGGGGGGAAAAAGAVLAEPGAGTARRHRRRRRRRCRARRQGQARPPHHVDLPRSAGSPGRLREGPLGRGWIGGADGARSCPLHGPDAAMCAAVFSDVLEQVGDIVEVGTEYIASVDGAAISCKRTAGRARPRREGRACSGSDVRLLARDPQTARASARATGTSSAPAC